MKRIHNLRHCLRSAFCRKFPFNPSKKQLFELGVDLMEPFAWKHSIRYQLISFHKYFKHFPPILNLFKTLQIHRTLTKIEQSPKNPNYYLEPSGPSQPVNILANRPDLNLSGPDYSRIKPSKKRFIIPQFATPRSTSVVIDTASKKKTETPVPAAPLIDVFHSL